MDRIERMKFEQVLLNDVARSEVLRDKKLQSESEQYTDRYYHKRVSPLKLIVDR